MVQQNKVSSPKGMDPDQPKNQVLQSPRSPSPDDSRLQHELSAIQVRSPPALAPRGRRRRRVQATKSEVLVEKIPIPTEPADVNYIGRILGPKGLSVRELENKTNCRIVIQGQGSIRDPVEEEQMRSRPGYEHLNEPLHIRVSITDNGNHQLASHRLRTACEILGNLLVVENDLYKQRQLVQLALVNGTYRPHHSIMKTKTRTVDQQNKVSSPKGMDPAQPKNQVLQSPRSPSPDDSRLQHELSAIQVRSPPALAPPPRGRRRRRVQATKSEVLVEKIPIPTEPADVNYIGRILGPKGLSVRELENKTNCRIVIQGQGSIRDPVEEEQMRSRPGYEHLNEPLHIRVSITDNGNHQLASHRLRTACEILGNLLVVKNDLYKQRQLVQLALMNGTYRPHHSIMKIN